MVKKSLTPFRGMKVETMIGVKKEKSPKTPKTAEKKKLKALAEQTPELLANSSLTSQSKKKKKSLASSIQELEQPGKSVTVGTPLSLKKKKKLSLIKTAEAESPAEPKLIKKKRSLAAEPEAESQIATEEAPKEKKLKKKSVVPAVDESKEQVQSQIAVGAPKGKKSKKKSLAPAVVEEIKEQAESKISPKAKKLKKKSIVPAVEESKVQTPVLKKKKKSVVATEDVPLPSKKKGKKSAEPEKSEAPVAENAAEETPKESEEKPKEAKGKKKGNKGKKVVNHPYTLFVGNLAFTTTEEEVREHFGKKGLNVTRVFFPKDKVTNLMKGFAFVDLPDNEQYNKGLQMHGSFINNRRVRVQCTMPGNKSTPGRTKAIKKTLLKYAGLNKKGIAFK